MDVALKITGVEKNTLGKLVVTVNLRGYLIRVLNERSIIDSGVFLSSVVGDSYSACYSVGDTC